MQKVITILLWSICLLSADMFSSAQVYGQSDNIAMGRYADSMVRQVLLKYSDTMNLSRRIDTIASNRIRGFDLGNVVVAQTAAVAINAGPRDIDVSVPGLLATDLALVRLITDLPAGYTIGNERVISAGTLRLRVTGPLLAIGASYSFTVKIIALRAP